MGEKWKTTKLQVSDQGNVRFLGKPVATVRRNGRRDRNGKTYQGIMLTLHRVVAAAFHGFPRDNAVVNHIDGNPENNRADNLEWVSQQQNKARSPNNTKGEDSWNSKLTEDEIRYIRSQRPKRFPEWASEFGVSLAAIHFVRNGRTKQPRFCTAEQAQIIRTQLSYAETARSLAKKFGVTSVNIYYIWKRKTWKHV